MTQVRSAGLKCSARWIEGRATLTIVASTMLISWARQTTTRAIQRALAEVRRALNDIQIIIT